MSDKAATRDGDDADAVVAEQVARARRAQAVYEEYDQAAVDEVVTAVGWAVVEPERNRELSELAVATTGIGDIEDKVTKNRRKTMGLLRDLQGARTVGVVAEYPELGLVEIARPVGVVGAVTPSTNPVATPTNKAINALKGRNAVIIAPSPKGQAACERLLHYIHTELDRVGAPRDLVQQLAAPVSKARTQALMKQVDLLVVTGSQNNVRSAYSSGTPAIGVGAGNVPVIIDETADLDDAAAKITASKTFDHATSCSSENSAVILDAVYDGAIAALERAGGVMLDEGGKRRLQEALWVDGKLNRDAIAQSAVTIAKLAGLDDIAAQAPRFLMVEESGVGGEYPFSGEKLSPVLAVYRARDFDAAFEQTRAILEHQGKGHSVGIHTANDDHVLRLGLEMPVCRVIVNQAHAFGNGGNFDNGLPFSLSMGCGTWGQNSISENLNYRHYLNTTRIARTIPPREPSMDDLFGDYRSRYGL
ncbi:acylating sulfoacetaldehyde dehydrogenase [Sediminicurvatus halobius]|uniref:Sulfoacetaldehyde dehydrogenase n=1 Tax=Sediminicurvatus halobius TaxID=2182432 RepID=A0A2U2N6H3_9GAMM|nr:aldehyde dehydrogenase family protein [Spiribacter halobius]PWG64559.1 sulfoacetaldehyde dehydrogenase [Spiribacter halobius]UEX79121.1 aldehyde dehydrogenase family protein [Spiribacter halobius]